MLWVEASTRRTPPKLKCFSFIAYLVTMSMAYLYLKLENFAILPCYILNNSRDLSKLDPPSKLSRGMQFLYTQLFLLQFASLLHIDLMLCSINSISCRLMPTLKSMAIKRLSSL